MPHVYKGVLNVCMSKPPYSIFKSSYNKLFSRGSDTSTVPDLYFVDVVNPINDQFNQYAVYRI